MIASASTAKYDDWTFGSVTPTRPVRPPDRARALRFVEYPRSRIARRARSRVAGATTAGRLSTREIVAADTPAARATSRIVGERACNRLPIGSDLCTFHDRGDQGFPAWGALVGRCN